MSKKSPAPKGAKSRAKVVTNRKPTRTTSLLRSRWSAFILVLAFIGVGTGTLTWVRAATETFTLWPNSAVPKTITDSDSKSVELGVKFKTQHAGYVNGVRFYKGPQNTGTHTGSLWSKDGRELARVTFKNETAGGWQTASFAQPIAIAANTTYIVSYHAPTGHYSATNNYFKKAHTSGPLTAQKGNNGVYKYGNRVGFPNETYQASNYWVDVVFSTSRFFPTPKPLPPTELKGTASFNAANLVWKASETDGVTKYRIIRDNATLTTVSGTATSYTDSTVTSGKSYTYKVHALDAAGTLSDASNSVTVVIPQPPTTDPDPNPEPNPDPDPPTPPTPGPVSAECAPFPAFPDANCTGYKHSTGFTSDTQLAKCQEKDGDEDGHLTREGAVYENCYFTFARIRAKNITIKNAKIRGSILPPSSHHDNAYDYQGLTLMDVEITPFTDAQLDSFCPQQPGWWQKGETCTTGGTADNPGNHNPDPGDEAPIGDGSNFTCIRCYIHHHTKSAGGGNNVRYVDTYVDGLTWTVGQHGAAIGFAYGVNSGVFHSNLRCYRWNTKGAQFQQGCSSALSIYDEGTLDNLIVHNNLFNTAGQYCVYTGGPSGKNVAFVDNIFGKQFAPRCGQAGPVHSWYPDNPGYRWQGNIWSDGSGSVSP